MRSGRGQCTQPANSETITPGQCETRQPTRARSLTSVQACYHLHHVSGERAMGQHGGSVRMPKIGASTPHATPPAPQCTGRPDGTARPPIRMPDTRQRDIPTCPCTCGKCDASMTYPEVHGGVETGSHPPQSPYETPRRRGWPDGEEITPPEQRHNTPGSGTQCILHLT